MQPTQNTQQIGMADPVAQVAPHGVGISEVNFSGTNSDGSVQPQPSTEQPNGQQTKAEQAPAQTATPCLCPECRQKVLDWLRAYERTLDAEAAKHQARYNYLAVGLSKHVATHLRKLRRELAAAPTQSIIELAQQLFEGEVVEL